jgi:Domain of unknown function (DUF4192)
MEIQTRAAVPEDVIAHAWYSLGYRPTASLVFVPADRPIRRSGLVLRANLPPPAHPREVVHHLVQRVADRLVRYGARSTVLLVASERVLQAPPVRLVRSLRTGLRRRGIELREVVGVTRRGFRSLGCHDRRCCPRSGHPLAAVTASPVAIMHASAGDTVAGDGPAPDETPAHPDPAGNPRSPEDGGPEPDSNDGLDPDDVDPDDVDPDDVDPDDDRNAFASAVSRAEALATDLLAKDAERRAQLGGRRHLSAGERDDWWRVWTTALATGTLPPDLRTGFASALADPGLRNGVLATAMGATADARGPTAIPGWRRAMETRPEGSDLVFRAVCVVILALREAPPGDGADSLAVLAVLTWYTGNSDDARWLSVEALRERRGHGLASTLLALVLTGTPPPWARSGSAGQSRDGRDPPGGDLPHEPPGC